MNIALCNSSRASRSIITRTAASQWFPRPSTTSTLHLALAAPLLVPIQSPWPISRSAAIQHARSIHLTPRLVHPVFQHICSALKAFNIAHRYIVPPRHTCDILSPPRSSSLIDTATGSRHSFGMPLRPLVSCQSLSAYQPSSMHACTACTTRAVIRLDFCGVLGLLRLDRTRNYDRHIQQCVRLACAPT